TTDPGQGGRGHVGGTGRPALRGADPGITGPAPQGHCQGEVALRKRRAGVRSGVTDGGSIEERSSDASPLVMARDGHPEELEHGGGDVLSPDLVLDLA